MAKYSFGFKLNVVQEYLGNKGGYRYLAKKHGIKTDQQVRKWVNAYQQFGIEGLLRKQKNRHYSFQAKLNAIELYQTSELSYREIANQIGLNNPALIASWMKKFREDGADGLSKMKGRPPKMATQKRKKSVQDNLTQLEKLEKENRMLKIELSYLKELRRLRLEDERKMRELHESFTVSDDGFRLTEILETLRFPKSTYMYWQKHLNRENPTEEIEKELKDIRQAHPNYGYRRMTQELKRRGFQINKKKVQRLIQKVGLQVRSFTRKSRKYNSYRGNVGKMAKNLVKRHFYTAIPHQKITTDTTEFKYFETDSSGILRQKKMYLNPFMDLYNSEIISYNISERPTAQAIMTGLEEAIKQTSDCSYRRTFHSDQGWAYQMPAYSSALKKHRIFQSMSRKGNCLDNSPMENFFGLLKQEIYYGKIYPNYNELKQAIKNYIHYYNQYRMKEKLHWQSPIEFRESQSLKT
ncbi:IS3 family transposase [Listeria monocytogenes]|nr:IS3 family transposase [Listeria monocytogenes]EII0396409.1 IS3 family transposase [Listeria monocytogenes]EIO8244338.1 IS3 family transposase [Listeria monocytogenes]EIS4449533.1 IS3 family transposase [Listeria monocytogenes]